MNASGTRNLPKWVVIIRILCFRDFGSAMYYNLQATSNVTEAEQVRAGSVVFLVGIGSLVCWKIWEHWKKGDENREGDSFPPKPSPKPTKNILSSFLEEDLVQDYEDEDPSCIHQLFVIAQALLKNAILGKYFGPESPEGDTPVSAKDPRLFSTRTNFDSPLKKPQQHFRFKEISGGSLSVLDEVSSPSSSCSENLPADEDSEGDLRDFRKTKKIRRRASERHRRYTASSLRSVSSQKSSGKISVRDFRRRNSDSSSVPYTLNSCLHQPSHDSCMSSETSPFRNEMSSGHLPLATEQRRCRGDGSETPESEELLERVRSQQHLLYQQKDVHENEESFLLARMQPDGQEFHSDCSLKKMSISLYDLKEKILHRNGKRGSISRDSSICSNLSDYLTSPVAYKRYPFSREDSICSNLSEVAPSECSEFSLDMKDDLARETLNCLHDIEQELDDLKISMLQMDEEMLRFSTLPNPYSLKMVPSDCSLGLLEPGQKPKTIFRGVLGTQVSLSVDSEVTDGSSPEFRKKGSVSSAASRCSSRSHSSYAGSGTPPEKVGFISDRPTEKSPAIPIKRTPSPKVPHYNDAMLSLEWDHTYLEQYSPRDANSCQNDSTSDVYQSTCYDRQQLLPDHSMLELDLEEELLSCSISEVTPSDVHIINCMTTSTDSAFHSTAGSRSTSSSPLPQFFCQSSMSSSGITSASDNSPATPNSDICCWEKLRIGSSEFGKRARKLWSSEEESGYVDEDTFTRSPLSPVHEIREREINETKSRKEINGNFINEDDVTIDDIIMGNLNSRLTTIEDPRLNAIGEKIDIITYASKEWRGNTQQALTIRQGYSVIPTELNLYNLRRIRGDNYCGIRASIYQVLSQGIPLPSCQRTLSVLKSEYKTDSSWLCDWSFAKRLTYSKDQVMEGFKECLERLEHLAMELKVCENRDNLLVARLNEQPVLDTQVCEAVKLHMLTCAVELFKRNVNEGNIPLFAMIMFARQSSTSPQSFMRNHLNPVGNTAGLEQVEMFLLGQTLNTTLQVVRPASYGREDYICYYPDSNIGIWPDVTLIAEDDRHYNILVK